MSVTVQQILGLLQTLAPPELACSWDNVGLLVDADTPVSRVLTTLDITAAVVQEAAPPLPEPRRRRRRCGAAGFWVGFSIVFSILIVSRLRDIRCSSVFLRRGPC